MSTVLILLFLCWLCTIINIKIIINDKKINLRETLVLFGIWSLLILLAYFEFIFAFHLGLLVVLAYCYKFKNYTLEKSIILTAIGMFSYAIIMLLIGVILYGRHILLISLLIVLANLLLSIFLVRSTKKIRKIISQKKEVQGFLLVIILVIDFFLQRINLPEDQTFEPLLEGIHLNFIFLGISLVSVLLYAFFIRMRYMVKAKEEQLAVMQSFLSEVEKQYLDTSRVRHDFQNIMNSLDGFVYDEDWEGLKEYYTEKVRKVSKDLIKNEIVLKDLHNLSIMEIKSIIAIKLMSVHSYSKIELSFECKEEINHIPIDTVDLVRVIGILLDNAIEELMEQGEGKLAVAIFKRKNETFIIVQNTCGPETPQLHLLNQVGFTTKEAGQGLGLSNLAEIESQYTNMSVETRVEEGLFTQIIVIEEVGR